MPRLAAISRSSAPPLLAVLDLPDDEPVQRRKLDRCLRQSPDEVIDFLASHDAPDHDGNPSVGGQPKLGAHTRPIRRLRIGAEVDGVGDDDFTPEAGAGGAFLLLDTARGEHSGGGETADQAMEVVDRGEGTDDDDAGTATAPGRQDARLGQR